MEKDNIKICYIGGGSRNWAWVLMQDLVFEKELRGTVELYDIKHEDAEANAVIGNRLLGENGGRWKFHAEPSLAQALSGSDFVLVSILPGDLRKWRSMFMLLKNTGYTNLSEIRRERAA